MSDKIEQIPFGPGLFSNLAKVSPGTIVAPVSTKANRLRANWRQDPLIPLIDVLNRVSDINSESEIFHTLLGQSELALGREMMKGAAEAWHGSRVRRDMSLEQVMDVGALPGAFKLLFNFYFRDDLYGRWIHKNPIIFSSGSLDGKEFRLSSALKACIDFALSSDWVGYSDSRGRIQTREALAALERQTNPGAPDCMPAEIAVTLGATAAISSIADFVASGRQRTLLRAICGVPNYVPLMAAVSRSFSTTLVPTPLLAGAVDISGIIERVRDSVDLVLLQTVNNPWGIVNAGWISGQCGGAKVGH